MKKLFPFIKNNLIVMFLTPIAGILLMLLVHFLPTDTMLRNVYWSMDMIASEFTDEVLIDGYRSTLTGNFTDCLMLEHAIYDYSEKGHSALDQVLHMYRAESYNVEGDIDGWEPGRSLNDYINGVPQPREVEYGRYWHGYLIVLKPLLLLTSVNNIRLLNAAIQLIAIGLILIGLMKKQAESLAKAFLISLPFMFFVSTFASLSLSICFYLLIFALLVQLKWDDKLHEKKKYYLFFLVVGMLTSYFDFLTYPLVTLGYPLCVYLFFHGKELKDQWEKTLLFCAEWGVGYISMWAAKWILSDLLSDSATIRDALATIGTRTQSANGGYGFSGLSDVLRLNLSPFMNRGYLLIILILAVITFLKLLKNRVKSTANNIKTVIPLFAISVSPFLWYMVTQNHSVQHWQFTCRIISLTIFAGYTALQNIVESKK